MRQIALIALVLLGGFAHAADYTTKTLKDTKAGYYKATSSYLVWRSSHPLSKVVNPTLKDWAVKLQQDWVKVVIEDQKEMEKPTEAWEQQIDQDVVRADSRVISVLASMYEYSGGAHPNHGSHAFNFAIVNGKPKFLTLEDLFKKGSKPGKLVSDKVIAKLKKDENAAWVQDGEVKAMTKQQLDHFTIGTEGITWYFDPYEVGPYVAGDFEVKLTWKELGPNFLKSIVSGR